MTAVINPSAVLPGEAFPRQTSFMDRLKNAPAKAEAISGEEMIGDYIVGDKLGQGSFGKVMLGTHVATKQKVALKFIDYSKTKNQKERDNIKREVRLIQLLDHPNCVKLLEVIEQKEVTCLVLEYISGGELFDYIVSHRRLKEPEAIRFLRQIVQGVEYCHANLVIHRDLKPENLLLDSNNNIKVNDFGLSNMMSPGSFLTTYCGSPLYSSPEIILETNYIGPEVDVWALGVIIFAMVTGYLPWDGDTLKQQVHNAIKARYEVPSHVSFECADLISRCICVDPKQRATIAEIRQHPWLSKGYNAPPLSCYPSKREVKEIDNEILEKLAEVGFDKATVSADLFAGRSTKQTFVLYFLMLDKKNKEKAEKSRLAEMSEPKTVPLPKNRLSTLFAIPENGSSSFAPVRPVVSEASGLPENSPPQVSNLAASAPVTPDIQRRGTIGAADGKNLRISWDPSKLTLPNLNLPTTPTKDTASSKATTPRKNSFFKIFAGKDKKEGDGTSSPRGDTINVSEYNPNGEDATGGRQRRNTVGGGDSPVAPAIKENDYDKNLRVSKGAFTVETTTRKTVPQIKIELERTFQVLDMAFKHTKKGTGYTVKVPNSKVEVELEICKVDKLDGIKGIKMKRASGDIWEYKEIYNKIIKEFRL
uniref:non-specific serine/threonine protein kinase n=1 Tax=Hordeum vulgare subsp. vulgare TaxID=112509 RepID=F2DIQ5_HORVV|nr:predicted protein [Hordeum vulgare subsp. vulgare]